MEWGKHTEQPVLELFVANIGWKKDTVRSIYFRAPHDDPNLKAYEWEMTSSQWPDLPAVLDVDTVTSRIEVPLVDLDQVGLHRLAQELREGTAEVVVVNARRRESLFKVPPYGTGPPAPNPDPL